jgi:tripartite-type tricarboxylate transporter receptor subunit TctC
MKNHRRNLLRLIAGAAALSAAARVATAQVYPTRPVRIVVGFRPGGPTDFFAHLIGQRLSERLGQPFIMENHSGAGSMISAEAVANAAPDGYTLLLIGASAAASSTLYPNHNFNLARDIAPVSGITRVPLLMQTNPSVPATTLPEFITFAKANPGKIAMASVGDGTTPHLAGELFKIMAGVDLHHVPYPDSAHALTGLLGGEVQVYFGPIAASIGYIRLDTLRALAVTSATRSEALPDTPTVAESVPGYEASGWYGIGAPRNTPAEIVDNLNTQINAALADPSMTARLADLGAEPMLMTPTEFGRFIVEETEKWREVIRVANIKPE